MTKSNPLFAFIFLFYLRKKIDNYLEKNTNKIHEAADVFYHLIMYLEANDVKIEDVMEELNKRKK